jgi:hypothetical protein
MPLSQGVSRIDRLGPKPFRVGRWKNLYRRRNRPADEAWQEPNASYDLPILHLRLLGWRRSHRNGRAVVRRELWHHIPQRDPRPDRPRAGTYSVAVKRTDTRPEDWRRFAWICLDGYRNNTAPVDVLLCVASF